MNLSLEVVSENGTLSLLMSDLPRILLLSKSLFDNLVHDTIDIHDTVVIKVCCFGSD